MNILNLKEYNKENYAEIPQVNPLRWINLKHVKDDTFTPVSYKWKCKDFLNDAVVSFHTGKHFIIYGFSVDTNFYNKNWEGMPVLLLNVTSNWIKNIENIVNPYLKSQGMPVLEPKHYEDDKWFLNIPRKYLDNTFYISQVTLFIRLANQSKEYSNWNDLLTMVDSADKNNFKACMNKPIGKMPDNLKKYLYYYNKDMCYPNEKDAIVTSHMHNCGVVNWDGQNTVWY